VRAPSSDKRKEAAQLPSKSAEQAASKRQADDGAQHATHDQKQRPNTAMEEARALGLAGAGNGTRYQAKGRPRAAERI
jgi:hypothetical protein